MIPPNHELLAAVIESPQDDSVRLVLADWLEEQGEYERSEFIRLQIELAQPLLSCFCHACRPDHPFADWRLCRQDLRRRERELLGPHREGEWGENAHKWFKSQMPAGVDFTLARGFIASVSLTCNLWLAHGSALVRQAPLESVRLVDKEPTTLGPRGRGVWMRLHPGGYEKASWALPPALFNCLSGFDEEGSDQETKFYSGGIEAAQRALSPACLLWARAQPLSCPECGGEKGIMREDSGWTYWYDCEVCSGTGKVAAVTP